MSGYTDAIDFPTEVSLAPIGIVRSPYRERFGTPVQAEPPREDAREASIELFADRVPEAALSDLDGMEYLWVITLLHLNKGFNARVQPPRGPRVKRGLLSTRSPHRPNPIGLTAARFLGVDGMTLRFASLDLLDGTPVLDIKPYVPYADAFPDARAGWIDVIDPTAPQQGRAKR